MDLSVILGTALFRLGSNLLNPTPPAPIPKSGASDPAFAKSLAHAIDKSAQVNATPPQEPHQWTEVQEILQLLQDHNPIALEIDPHGHLYIRCEDDTRHLVVLTPQRQQELQHWITENPRPHNHPLPNSTTSHIQTLNQIKLLPN